MLCGHVYVGVTDLLHSHCRLHSPKTTNNGNALQIIQLRKKATSCLWYWVRNKTLAARQSERMCACLSVGMYLLTCHRQIVCLCDDPRMCPIASGTH